MPTADRLEHLKTLASNITLIGGALLVLVAVAVATWKGIKRFLGWADFIDGASEFLKQAQGRPASRDDLGEPNLMEQVRIMRIEQVAQGAEQVAQREILDSLVLWRAGQRERPPDPPRRRSRPA